MPEGTRNADGIDALLEEVRELHSAPSVAQSILRLTRAADFDIEEVVRGIECDPALASRLLRVVNSSRYGLRHRVSNLRHAVAYLGQRTLRLIAMTFSIADVFRRGAARQLYSDYWQHAVTMAIAASRLAERGQAVNQYDAYVAGLLADLGTLLFAQVKREPYIELYRAASSGTELVAAEQRTFGFNHAALGSRLLEMWEIPEPISRTVRDHHSAAQGTDPLKTAVRAGDLLAEALWGSGDPSLGEAHKWLERHYAFTIDQSLDLAASCSEAVTLEADLYGIHLQDALDVDALIREARNEYLRTSIETAMDFDSLSAVLEDPNLGM